jgi:hypothetical protein
MMTLKNPLFGIVEDLFHQTAHISEKGLLRITPELYTFVMRNPAEIEFITSWYIHDSVNLRALKQDTYMDVNVTEKGIFVGNLVEEGRIWRLSRL